MMLLDTVVLSELRKARPSPAVTGWLRQQEDHTLFVSVVSIGEIERGIEKQRGTNRAFADALTTWLNTLIDLYGDRILPVTPEIARLWGRLSARLGNDGVDLVIAATALCHALPVATRNVRHFAPAGVTTVNPFQSIGA